MFNFAFLSIQSRFANPTLLYIFFAFHGIFLSMFLASFWPCVKFLAPKNLTTTAFSLVCACSEAIYFVGFIAIGETIDRSANYSAGYHWVIELFVAIFFITSILSGIAFVSDYFYHDKVLYNGSEEIQPCPSSLQTDDKK